MYVQIEGVKRAPESMMIADDTVLRGGKEASTTEHLDRWRKILEEREGEE